eukprot:4373321-Amphidinium_carterae.1
MENEGVEGGWLLLLPISALTKAESRHADVVGKADEQGVRVRAELEQLRDECRALASSTEAAVQLQKRAEQKDVSDHSRYLVGNLGLEIAISAALVPFEASFLLRLERSC